MNIGKIVKMRPKNAYMLLAAIAICQSAGIIGSVFTYPSIQTWYAALEKPFFSPPNWVFAPIWLALYTLMGIAAYLVWEKGIKKKNVRAALQLFGAQLALNALWSILFFGMRSLLYSFVEIVVLWILIAATTFKFYKISKRAGMLMVPYILWVSFAMVLNFSILMLNA